MTSVLFETRTLTVSIPCSPRRVYEFVRDARNLPLWSFFQSVAPADDDDGWVLDTPDGPVTLGFAPPNPFGVLDHRVTLGSGATVDVPMRVIPNGDGAEVLFTLLRAPDMSDEKFAADAGQVTRDLAALKVALSS